MQSIHISGRKRLGIVCSGFWMLLALAVYILGIGLYSLFPRLASTLDKLYTWVEGEPYKDGGIDVWPLTPNVDVIGLSLLVFIPVIVGWTVLYVIPRSIRWVRDGFQHER